MNVSFEEFVGRRLAELMRYAFVLCGDAERAESLVVQTLRSAYPHWPVITAAGRPFAAMRTGLTRIHLADADADNRAGQGLQGLQGLTPVSRAVLVLASFSGQTLPEIATALEIAPAAVEQAQAEAMRQLHLDDEETSTPSDAESHLLDLVDGLADAYDPDAGRAADAIRHGLDAADHDASTAAYTALFGTPATDDADADAGLSGVEGDDAEVSSTSDAAATSSTPVAGRARRRLRIAVGVVVVAAVAVVAVAVSLLVSHRTQSTYADPARSAAPTTSAATPTPVVAGSLTSPINTTLPDGRILGQFFGSGSRKVAVGVYSVAAGRNLVLNAICSGSGRVQIAQIRLSRCNNTPSAAVVSSGQITSIDVTADTSTTWRVVVVDSPPPDTDGALHYPVSKLLTSAPVVDRGAQESGTGSAQVPLVSGTTDARVEDVQLILTCTGSGGVTFSGGDGRFDDLYARTCFPGWSVAFDVPDALLPGTLTVKADTSTSWRLVVVRA